MTATPKIIDIPFSDGYAARARFWPGEKAAVLYLHGIQSHGLWFEASAGYLAEQGYAVLLPDRRGSGLNREARGDVRHFRRWIADTAELARDLAHRTGKPKVHLLAVSWGGKLAAAAAQAHPELFASLTLVTPGIFPAVDLPLAVKIHIALSIFARPRKPFPIPLNEPQLFTDNPVRQRFIETDENRLTRVTARFLGHSILLDRRVRIADLHFPFPVKLYLAGHERIIDNPRTLRLYRSWRAPRKALACYDDACHTLEFEPDPSAYLADLKEWMDEVSA